MSTENKIFTYDITGYYNPLSESEKPLFDTYISTEIELLISDRLTGIFGKYIKKLDEINKDVSKGKTKIYLGYGSSDFRSSTFKDMVSDLLSKQGYKCDFKNEDYDSDDRTDSCYCYVSKSKYV